MLVCLPTFHLICLDKLYALPNPPTLPRSVLKNGIVFAMKKSHFIFDGQYLGLITSRCSGYEPALTPEGTAGRVDLPLSISTNQKVACSNRAGINDFFSEQILKMAESMLFDIVCDRVLERFKLENLKDLQRKALEKLVNGEYVFVSQPTGSGKSLIYQSSPMAIDIMKETTFKSIAVVISPLTSLM